VPGDGRSRSALRLSAPPDASEDDLVGLLSEGEIEILGLLPRSSNRTFLARVVGGDGRTLAVYKPRAGETPLWDFPEGTLCLRDRPPDGFRRIALFDAVVNNADRKSGHCLLAHDGRVFAVDHGVCFNEAPKLRTVIWDFAGERIPTDELHDLRRLAGELSGGRLRGALGEMLSPREIAATRRRVERLITVARFPEPGADRPYPWPPT
jgi:hypothetical protein